MARCCRRDILHTIAIFQRFQSCYSWQVIDDLLHLVRYLKTTREQMMTFTARESGPFELYSLADASYATCPITRTSHGGHALYLFGCPILVVSKKQSLVSLSTMESEYMQAHSAAVAIAWAVRLLAGMGLEVRTPVPLLEDNIATTHLALRPSLNAGRARHMEVRWHWLQLQVAAGRVRLLHLPTEWQIADILTKSLPKKQHQFLTELLQGDHPSYSGEIRRVLLKYHRTQGRLTEATVKSQNAAPKGDAPLLHCVDAEFADALGKRQSPNGYVVDFGHSLILQGRPQHQVRVAHSSLDEERRQLSALDEDDHKEPLGEQQASNQHQAFTLGEQAEKKVLEALEAMTLATEACSPPTPHLERRRHAITLLTQACPEIRQHPDLLHDSIQLLEETYLTFHQQLVDQQARALTDIRRQLAARQRHATPERRNNGKNRRYVTPPPEPWLPGNEVPQPSFTPSPTYQSSLEPLDCKRNDPDSIHYEGGAPPAANGERGEGPESAPHADISPGRRAWSPHDTQTAVRTALGGQHYPHPQTRVAISGQFRRGKKFHHVTCYQLYCAHGALAGEAFHGGVRITTVTDALQTGYTACRHCKDELSRMRGG